MCRQRTFSPIRIAALRLHLKAVTIDELRKGNRLLYAGQVRLSAVSCHCQNPPASNAIRSTKFDKAAVDAVNRNWECPRCGCGLQPKQSTGRRTGLRARLP